MRHHRRSRTPVPRAASVQVQVHSRLKRARTRSRTCNARLLHLSHAPRSCANGHAFQQNTTGTSCSSMCRSICRNGRFVIAGACLRPEASGSRAAPGAGLPRRKGVRTSGAPWNGGAEMGQSCDATAARARVANEGSSCRGQYVCSDRREEMTLAQTSDTHIFWESEVVRVTSVADSAMKTSAGDPSRQQSQGPARVVSELRSV